MAAGVPGLAWCTLGLDGAEGPAAAGKQGTSESMGRGDLSALGWVPPTRGESGSAEPGAARAGVRDPRPVAVWVPGCCGQTRALLGGESCAEHRSPQGHLQSLLFRRLPTFPASGSVVSSRWSLPIRCGSRARPARHPCRRCLCCALRAGLGPGPPPGDPRAGSRVTWLLTFPGAKRRTSQHPVLALGRPRAAAWGLRPSGTRRPPPRLGAYGTQVGWVQHRALEPSARAPQG